MDQLDIGGKSYHSTPERVILDIDQAPEISRALYVLGYASACIGNVGSITVDKPSRRRTFKKRIRIENAHASPQNHRRHPPGAPKLLTSERARTLSRSQPSKIEQPVVSRKYMISVIDRLARPREVRNTEPEQECDSPRIGFRLTVMKRSCKKQKEYMQNLSVPRAVYEEPCFNRIRDQPLLTPEALADLLNRLSKPHTLQSILKRYGASSNSDTTLNDLSLPDKPLQIMIEEENASPSPYLSHLLEPFIRRLKGKVVTLTDRGLQAGLESACQAISNMVDKGERDFPGKIDSYVTTMLEKIVLSSSSQHFHDNNSATPLTDYVPSTCVSSDLKTSMKSLSLLDLVRLLKPSELLLCRLNVITRNLIRLILSLHENS